MIARALLLLCLVGCGSEPEREESEPPNEPTDEPRGPRGAGPVRCEGASDDPEEIEAILARSDTDLGGAIESMEALVGANPGSATARVRLGELWLRSSPPRARDARVWFERALALQENGCTLGERDAWAALEGSALSHIIEGDYAQALPILRRSIARWPDVRTTRYNLACALCRTGDLDGCERELHAVLHDERPQPAWLGEQARAPGHYAALARTDADLAPLRADPERFARATGP